MEKQSFKPIDTQELYLDCMRFNPMRIKSGLRSMKMDLNEFKEFSKMRDRVNDAITAEPLKVFADFQELCEAETTLYREAIDAIKTAPRDCRINEPRSRESTKAMLYAVGRYQRQISYFLGCRAAAEGIADFLQRSNTTKILEIGCGRQALGLFTVSNNTEISWEFTDANRIPPLLKSGAPQLRLFDPTYETEQQCDPRKITTATAGALVLSWPQWRSTMAVDALAQFQGNLLIYMGEGRDGCTADDDFFDKLSVEWKPVELIDCGPRQHDPRSWSTDKCWILAKKHPICQQIVHSICSHNEETSSDCTACDPSWHGWHCTKCKRFW